MPVVVVPVDRRPLAAGEDQVDRDVLAFRGPPRQRHGPGRPALKVRREPERYGVRQRYVPLFATLGRGEHEPSPDVLDLTPDVDNPVQPVHVTDSEPEDLTLPKPQ